MIFIRHRFPAQYSTVAEELGKVAGETGVHLTAVKYDDKDALVEGLRKLNIEIALSGSYLARSEVHQRAGARQDVLPG